MGGAAPPYKTKAAACQVSPLFNYCTVKEHRGGAAPATQTKATARQVSPLSNQTRTGEELLHLLKPKLPHVRLVLCLTRPAKERSCSITQIKATAHQVSQLSKQTHTGEELLHILKPKLPHIRLVRCLNYYNRGA